MRVVITGGAGFIGRAVVGKLADRGDEVVALVRDPARATHLRRERVSILASDLSSVAAMTAQMHGADGVIHAAGSYRIGIKRSEHERMREANTGATERVLDAAIAAGVPRIVYVSTVGVFGNTRGVVVDETYRRDPTEGFLSVYDETKFRAHEAAQKRLAAGAPIIIVQPSQVYGPDDHSLSSEQVRLAHSGKLRFMAMGTTGACWVHVDDLATGVVAALDRGRIGESYILAGECLRMAEAFAIAARVGGRTPPRVSMPTPVLRAIAYVNDPLGGLPGLPASLRETISAGHDVTYFARPDKAMRELGFSYRPLEQGVADTFGTGTAVNPDAAARD